MRRFHFCLPLVFLNSAASVSAACPGEPGASKRVRAQRLQGVRRLLHGAPPRGHAHPAGRRRSVPGLGRGDVLGGLRLRVQGSVAPSLRVLPH